MLAALVVAHAFGEGIGRLACISFGCCYGRRLDDVGPRVQRLFARVPFVFEGETKKIAYAGGMEAVPVVPIQAVTAILYAAIGLVGLWLYPGGRFAVSLVVTGVFVQGWRIVSETLRSDHRGRSGFTVYQGLSLVLVVLLVALGIAGPEAAVAVQPGAGLAALWDPAVLLSLQAVWVVVFLYTGRSTVTGSVIRFHVVHEHL